MHKHIADKWTKILRSGEFTQGMGTLRDLKGNYCCLGVLCEMAAREGVIPPAWLQFPTSAQYTYGISNNEWSDDFNAGVLPTAVQRWAGMESNNGTINDLEALSAFNDKGMSFESIADVIDANVDVL